MNKVNKKDLMVCYHSEKCYRLSIRKKVFFFFNSWIPLTYQETENSKEVPLEFESFEGALKFIEYIAE
jgi:hypothetical protein